MFLLILLLHTTAMLYLYIFIFYCIGCTCLLTWLLPVVLFILLLLRVFMTRSLFQVQQSVMSSSHDPTGSSSSLRRQPTYPPPVSSHSSFRLHENTLFSATPNLYAYPASAALASVSHAVDQMQGGSSRHGREGGAYSSLALLQKSGSLALGGSTPGQYGNHHQQQLGGQPFHHAATYQQQLNQYPFLWEERGASTKWRPRLETSTRSSRASVIRLFNFPLLSSPNYLQLSVIISRKIITSCIYILISIPPFGVFSFRIQQVNGDKPQPVRM